MPIVERSFQIRSVKHVLTMDSSAVLAVLAKQKRVDVHADDAFELVISFRGDHLVMPSSEETLTGLVKDLGLDNDDGIFRASGKGMWSWRVWLKTAGMSALLRSSQSQDGEWFYETIAVMPFDAISLPQLSEEDHRRLQAIFEERQAALAAPVPVIVGVKEAKKRAPRARPRAAKPRPRHGRK